MSSSYLAVLRKGHRTIYQNLYSGYETFIHVGGFGEQFFEKWQVRSNILEGQLNSTVTIENYNLYPEIFEVSDNFLDSC